MDNQTHDNERVAHWLVQPLPKDVQNRVQQMARCDDVVRIAVLPDVHLAKEYCVGTAVATRSRIMPFAVGGDIGCGMVALRVNELAERLISRQSSQQLLRLLGRFVPFNKHRAATVSDRLPESLRIRGLSHPRLEKMALRDGRVQMGTLGRGNHFLEFQVDVEGVMWLMIHSGSRALGQAITTLHLRNTVNDGPLLYFEAESSAGQDYLNDVAWARQYARQNRLSMLWVTAELLQTLWSVDVDADSLIESDHNHVRQEEHMGQMRWVHRKGAQSAAANELGVIPGSMGTPSYHVVGRGCQAALNSSSHGAGRRQSRTEARSKVSVRSLQREMGRVFFDQSKSNALRDEAPSAYKDIRQVLQAQRELVKIVRVLRPLVSYKASGSFNGPPSHAPRSGNSGGKG